MADCDICTEKVGDNAYVCTRCWVSFPRNLGEVPALVEEVETTALRQSRTAKAGGIGIVLHVAEEDRPLPFNEFPRVALRELVLGLRGITSMVVSTRGVVAPVDSPTHASRFLLRHLEWIRHRDDAAEVKRELESLIHDLRRTIDLPPERVFAGPCGAVDYACPLTHDHTPDCTEEPVEGSVPCTGSVFGGKGRGKDRAVCDTCGCVHDMKDRRGWLLEAVRDQLDYAARISQALSNLGQPVMAATIRKWAERGRLVPHGHDEHQRPLYRIGDVTDLLIDEKIRAAKKQAS